MTYKEFCFFRDLRVGSVWRHKRPYSNEKPVRIVSKDKITVRYTNPFIHIIRSDWNPKDGGGTAMCVDDFMRCYKIYEPPVTSTTKAKRL